MSSIDFVNLRALAPSWQKKIASLPPCEPRVKPIREFVVNQKNRSPVQFGASRCPVVPNKKYHVAV